MKRSMWRKCGAVAVLLATCVSFAGRGLEVRSESPAQTPAQPVRAIPTAAEIAARVQAREEKLLANLADPSHEYDDLVPLVRVAMRDDTPAAQAAVLKLHAAGPRALAFLMTHKELPSVGRYVRVLDEVAQQKDVVFSGLYWHTDLDAALKVAQEQKKPVLSLRLLGKLTEELSCANSRFFRTALYPSPQVKDLLAQKFVLHWQTVRPAPVITIDFADGRQIRQTITGNSLHLMLDWQGRVVDVLPGLYGAEEFANQLQAGLTATEELGGLTATNFAARSRDFHKTQLADSQHNWARDWQQMNSEQAPSLDGPLTDEQWQALARLYEAGSAPKESAAAAVYQKGALPRARKGKAGAREAGLVAMTKSGVEMPFFAGMQKLTESIALDTVKNEYQLHQQIHHLLSEEPAKDRNLLVEYVYEKLFLSPLDDPWYGLSQPDVYSALPQNGRINAVVTNAGR